jgi:putative sigma-54 modulation protein
MKISIVGRKIKLTDAIKDFIEEKVGNTLGYINNIVWVQVVVGVEKKQHFAEIVAHVGHQTIKATAISDDLYSAMDKVLDKIETQAKKYKDKIVDSRRSGANISELTASSIVDEIRFSVIKNVPIKPMTKEEAVSEMERLGYNFWLFVDKKSKQTQVVFKRYDSTYGILLPEKK